MNCQETERKLLEGKLGEAITQSVLAVLFPRKSIQEMLSDQEITPQAGNDDGCSYYSVTILEIAEICDSYHNQKIERGE